MIKFGIHSHIFNPKTQLQASFFTSRSSLFFVLIPVPIILCVLACIFVIRYIRGDDYRDVNLDTLGNETLLDNENETLGEGGEPSPGSSDHDQPEIPKRKRRQSMSMDRENQMFAPKRRPERSTFVRYRQNSEPGSTVSSRSKLRFKEPDMSLSGVSPSKVNSPTNSDCADNFSYKDLRLDSKRRKSINSLHAQLHRTNSAPSNSRKSSYSQTVESFDLSMMMDDLEQRTSDITSLDPTTEFLLVRIRHLEQRLEVLEQTTLRKERDRVIQICSEDPVFTV